MSLILKVKKRDLKKDKPNQLRAHGQLPAVLYGRGINNLHLVLNTRDFEKIFEKAGESQLIQLEVENDKTPHNVLIHDIDKDSLSNKFRHVDFYQVRMDEKITAEIPLVFEGESEAVKTLSGVLVKNIHMVKISSLPSNLPAELKIDITPLKALEDKILIKDLLLPAGVEILANPEEIVVLVAPPRSEEELAKLEAEVKEDISAIKVAEKEAKPAEELPPKEEPEAKPESKKP